MVNISRIFNGVLIGSITLVLVVTRLSSSKGAVMEQETIDAVIAAVCKWDLIAQGIGVDNGTDNCPLCIMFFDRAPGTGCDEECPVFEVTSQELCNGSPFKYTNLESDYTIPEHHGYITTEEFAAIEDEIEFLISLLPTKLRGKLYALD